METCETVKVDNPAEPDGYINKSNTTSEHVLWMELPAFVDPNVAGLVAANEAAPAPKKKDK